MLAVLSIIKFQNKLQSMFSTHTKCFETFTVLLVYHNNIIFKLSQFPTATLQLPMM